MDPDAYRLSLDVVQRGRGRSADVARALAEEVDQERGIDVDHSLGDRAAFERRARTWASIASRASSESRARPRAARRSAPVARLPRRCLMVWEKDSPGRLQRERISY